MNDIIKNIDSNKRFDCNEEKHNEVHKEDEKTKIRFFSPLKQFENRRSLIVELIEDNSHLKSCYNIVAGLTCFIMFSLNVKEYIQNGRISPALHLIYKAFGKLHIVLIIWLGNNIFTFLCYYVFIGWAKIRKIVHNKFILDKLGIMLLIIYYGFSFITTTFLIFYLKIPFASSLIISQDSIRFLMKVHAFIRSNAPKVLINSNKKNINLPTFFQYVHFLYIPTTIYRDEYPRSNKIRWSFVLHRFIEILWCISCMAHLYVYSITPIFKDICSKPITILDMFVLCLECSVPCLLLTWLIFFSTIHSAQNGVGELIQFGDKMFYSDWWDLKNMPQYYKKWNYVVGNFLQFYVNKEFYEIVFPGNRGVAKFLTFLISGLVHEWTYITAMGFFCPITTFLMLYGAFFSDFYICNQHINLTKWKLYPLGAGIMGLFFCVEVFARKNLPLKNDELFVFWSNCFV